MAAAGTHTSSQDQTRDAFSYKWGRRESYESPAFQEFTRDWLLAKYCGGDAALLEQWLTEGTRILDAGCGAGYSATAFFGDLLRRTEYIGIDISDAVEVARARFAEFGYPGAFIQASVFEIPLDDESVDLAFSEGVLHHTDDMAAAIAAVARKIRRGGRFLFYVYARKGPIREYVDDLVRAHLATMSDEEAWEALEPLTKLGIALGELNVSLEIPEDIPYLGIQKGTVDVQRFFYYAVMKAYYRPELGFDEMHHINFDWYRPLNCHRHTEDEVRQFSRDAGLEIERFHSEPSGFAVVAVRP